MDLKNLYPELNPEEVYNNFLHDLRLSATGKNTSIRFIKNQLPQNKNLKDSQLVQVFVVGGTNCRSGLFQEINDSLVLNKIMSIRKPKFPTKESFCEFITENVSEGVNKIIINSADTIKPVFENNKIDGIFLISSKENKMEGLAGQKIGEELEKYIFLHEQKSITVEVINDSVCLLLSGLTEYSWNNLAAGIIGTGFNLAYFLDDKTVINLEAGGYTNFTQSEPGEYIDGNSTEKGEYLSEKEIGGGYLFQHYNFFLRNKKLEGSLVQDTEELSRLASENNSIYSTLAQEVFNHSAILAGSQMAALLKFLDKDINFVMQGSVFWHAYGYKEKISEVISRMVPEYNFKFLDFKDADIIGATQIY